MRRITVAAATMTTLTLMAGCQCPDFPASNNQRITELAEASGCQEFHRLDVSDGGGSVTCRAGDQERNTAYNAGEISTIDYSADTFHEPYVQLPLASYPVDQMDTLAERAKNECNKDGKYHARVEVTPNGTMLTHLGCTDDATLTLMGEEEVARPTTAWDVETIRQSFHLAAALGGDEMNYLTYDASKGSPLVMWVTTPRQVNGVSTTVHGSWGLLVGPPLSSFPTDPEFVPERSASVPFSLADIDPARVVEVMKQLSTDLHKPVPMEAFVLYADEKGPAVQAGGIAYYL